MKNIRNVLSFLIAGAKLLALAACSAGQEEQAAVSPSAATGPQSLAAASASQPPFTDVPADADYAEAVAWCWEQGLMRGTSDTEFSPNDTLTRAMVATVLYRAAGEPSVNGGPGFTDIAQVDIMDADGSIALPVTGGDNLKENYVGTHFNNYGSFLVLSHFKGHAMAGFGGAIKNISIGIASSQGKGHIHSGGSGGSMWGGSQDAFLESMGEAGKSVVEALDGQIVYISVMNRLSVDCDCDGNPAQPDMHDIGILASTDPVALDQACVDLVYAPRTAAPSFSALSPVTASTRWNTPRRLGWAAGATSWRISMPTVISETPTLLTNQQTNGQSKTAFEILEKRYIFSSKYFFYLIL